MADKKKYRTPAEQAKFEAAVDAAAGGAGAGLGWGIGEFTDPGITGNNLKNSVLGNAAMKKRAMDVLGENVREIRPGSSVGALEKFMIKHPDILKKLKRTSIAAGVGALGAGALGAGAGYIRGHLAPQEKE